MATEDISIPASGGGTMRAAVAVPDRPGPHPGVLVIHEAFGLNDDMRRVAERFASQGYVALAPDLFSHGNRAICLTRTLVAGFTGVGTAAVVDDIRAAVLALGDRDDTDDGRIALCGFCMGGNFALAAGPSMPVQAVAANYGATPRSERDLEGICPVVASYGSLDQVMRKEPEKLERALTALGVPHDIKVYERVGHSFMSDHAQPRWMSRLPNPMHPGYDESAAEDAWGRIFRFFKEHV